MAEQLKTVAPIATSVGGALLGASLFGPGGAFVGTAGGGILGGSLGGAAGAALGRGLTGEAPSLTDIALGGIGGGAIGSARPTGFRAAQPTAVEQLAQQAQQGIPLTQQQLQTLGTAAVAQSLHPRS